MKIEDRILGYKLVTNGTVSSGRCTWAFAEKDGKQYFVKQFNSPKYPVEGAPGSASKKKDRLEKCETFEAAQRRILQAIRHKIASGGSIVAPLEFGRAGAAYYKIYDRIDVANLTPKNISSLSRERKLLIMRVVAHSLSILHKIGIVHGDLKPANILIKISDTGTYTSKLIDFDDSYFEREPPQDAELVIGDPAYYSPELLDYILTNDPAKRAGITTKSDIFALGLIFAEYWTGDLPEYNASKYNSCATAVLHGDKLSLSKHSLPSEVGSLLTKMFEYDPLNRPSASAVLSWLKSGASEGRSEETPEGSVAESRLIRRSAAAGDKVMKESVSSTSVPSSDASRSRLIRKSK